jgi:hypothetical protein
MSPLGGTTATGFLVGYSPAGASADEQHGHLRALPGTFTLARRTSVGGPGISPAPVSQHGRVHDDQHPGRHGPHGHILSFARSSLASTRSLGAAPAVNTAGSSSVPLPVAVGLPNIVRTSHRSRASFFTQSASPTRREPAWPADLERYQVVHQQLLMADF